MTRSTLLTLVEELADAVGSPRWGTTLKLQMLGEAHWREWKGLLNANRMLRVGTRTVTTDSDGRFLKTAMNTGSGDATETWYRILSLRQGNFFYQQARYEDYPLSPNEVLLPQVWFEYGDQIQVIPATQGNEVTVVVSQLPQRADLLADNTSTVVFPDGYDMILAYETAASMLMKGAAETNLSVELSGKAQSLRDRMMQDLARPGTWPMRMTAMDDKFDWGGV